MDADGFLDSVRAESKTELSRLGSSKSLYADTGGEMAEGPVLRAVADLLYHAAATAESWADGSDGAAGLFAAVAETAEEGYGVVAGELGDHDPDEAPPIVRTLREFGDDRARAGGLVGWLLVAEKKVGQAVGFFVGQAAPGAADTFRGVRTGLQDAIDESATALEELCDTDDDWSLAEDAAVETIAAAYDDYFETLEAMGVNPKPVC